MANNPPACAICLICFALLYIHPLHPCALLDILWLLGSQYSSPVTASSRQVHWLSFSSIRVIRFTELISYVVDDLYLITYIIDDLHI